MQDHYERAILEASDARFQRHRADEMARLATATARQALEEQAQLLEIKRLIEGFDVSQLAEIMEEARANLLDQNQNRPRGG